MAKKAKSASGKRNSSAAKPAKKPSTAAKKAPSTGTKAKTKAPAKASAKPATKPAKAAKSAAKTASGKPSSSSSKAKSVDKSRIVEKNAVSTVEADVVAAAPKVAVQAPLKEAASPTVQTKSTPVPAKPTSEKKAKSETPAPAEKKSKKSKSLSVSLDRAADLGEQWNALFERSRDLEALPYKMSATYEARTPIQHKVLGWGFILSIQNDRLEVLFKDGIKILISNYKG